MQSPLPIPFEEPYEWIVDPCEADPARYESIEGSEYDGFYRVVVAEPTVEVLDLLP